MRTRISSSEIFPLEHIINPEGEAHTVEQGGPDDPYCVGLHWDKWTSAVETSIVRDVLALQAEVSPQRLTVSCLYDNADPVLKALGVIRTSLITVPRFWRTYQVGADVVYAPEGSSPEAVVEPLVLYRRKREELMVQEDDNPGYPLKDFGRALNWNPFDRRPPSAHGVPSMNPLVNLVWSSTAEDPDKS